MAMMLLLLTTRKVCIGSRELEFNNAIGKLINAPMLLLEEALLVHKILYYTNSPKLMLPCWLILMQLELCMSTSALVFLKKKKKHEHMAY